MGRNTTIITGRLASLPLTAAALFLFAGTPAAVAQPAPKSKTPSPVTQAPPQAAAPSNGNPNATGRLITHAGDRNKPQADKPGAEIRNPLESQTPETGGDKVKVDEHLIVDLHVNDEDLANVLQMLSIQSQKNIVTSKNVSAVVTANLYGVTFFEALDAILHVNGYGYIERGNFIYVYTLDELNKIEEQQRHQVWKVLKLDYLNGTDAAEFVKPLLSEHGQIKTNGKAPAYTIAEAAPTGDESFAQASTLMVFDYEENLAEIEKVIKEIDTRPAQVLVEATILQTTLNEANAFGVDFSVIGDLSFADFVNIGGPLKAVDGLINGSGSASSGSGSSGSGGTGGTGSGSSSGSGSTGTPLPSDGRGGAVVSSVGNTASPGGLKLGVVYNDVAAFLRVLDEVSDTAILSRPNILTLNRQSARVLVGRKVGYLNTTSTDTSTTQTVEFLDTGTQLYFRPFVSADGMVRMELKPKVSEAVIRNVTNSGGAAVTIPDEISNELTTNVMVKDGQTIVLGGLFRESTQTSRRQVPGLGDIPVLGVAFRGHDDTTQRSEIIFMITPTIMNDAVLMDQADRGKATVDRIRTGTREALLPWSREKRTQQLVVQATDLMQQGKNDEALYKVQRALEMNHMQPDALQLREALMSKKSSWPTRSVQTEIINSEVSKWIGKTGKASALPNTMVKEKARTAAKMPAAAPSVAIEQNGQVVEQEKTQDPTLTFTNAQVEPPAQDPTPEPMANPEPPADPAAEPAPEPAPEPGSEPKPEASAALMQFDPATAPAMDPAAATFDPNDPAMAIAMPQDPGAFDPSSPTFDPANMPADPANSTFDPASPTIDPAGAAPAFDPNAVPATDPQMTSVLPGPLPAGATATMPAAKSVAATPSSAKSAMGFRSVWGMMRAFGMSQGRNAGDATAPTYGAVDNK